MNSCYDVILKPVLSEKSYDGIANKRYTFVVAKEANKTEIKLSVEKIFDVKVQKVNTMNVSGKKKRLRGKEGTTASYKKAIVTLKPDSKAIEFFESLS